MAQHQLNLGGTKLFTGCLVPYSMGQKLGDLLRIDVNSPCYSANDQVCLIAFQHAYLEEDLCSIQQKAFERFHCDIFWSK
mmetsp:Transcript_31030/g.66051  ORF Transcript_31030/g.66051 Transcript_31030/m.66051 type:complete len:80 (-) Transcript_31030:40-279(-)